MPESFGQMVSLTPGSTYRVSGHLRKAIRSDLAFAGSYELYLTDGVGQGQKVVVGHFCPVSSDAWEERSFTFVAPPEAASLPLLVFDPIAGPGTWSYPGLDEVSLTDVTTCP